MRRCIYRIYCVTAFMIYSAVRPIGALLPPRLLFALIAPFAATVTLAELLFAEPTFAAFDRLPAPLGPSGGLVARRWAVWRQRTRWNLARMASFWYDLFPTARWRRLCRFEGPTSPEALGSGARPIILATLHYGPMEMLSYWLRSHGIPVAYLFDYQYDNRPRYRLELNEAGDRAVGLEGRPATFRPDQIALVRTFLKADGVLIVAVDGGEGRRRVEAEAGGVGLSLGRGAFVLASLVGAAVIPCAIVAGPSASVTIHLGDELPPDDLNDRHRHRALAARLLEFALPVVRSSPGACSWWLIRHLRSTADPGPVTEAAGPSRAEAIARG